MQCAFFPIVVIQQDLDLHQANVLLPFGNFDLQQTEFMTKGVGATSARPRSTASPLYCANGYNIGKSVQNLSHFWAVLSAFSADAF